MATKSLKLSLDDDGEFCVVGVQSPLSMVKLAFYINTYTALNFIKQPQDYALQISNHQTALFPVFVHESDHLNLYLISNISLDSEGAPIANTLFSVPVNHYFLYKNADAWICCEKTGVIDELFIISQLKGVIPQTQLFPLTSLSPKYNKRLSWLFYD